MLVDNRYGGATASEAQTTALNLIDQIREADGIFCSIESLTFGMLLALRRKQSLSAKRNSSASTPRAAAYHRGVEERRDSGARCAVVNPTKDGLRSRERPSSPQCIGEKVPQNVDSGVALITPENVNTPEIQDLLK